MATKADLKMLALSNNFSKMLSKNEEDYLKCLFSLLVIESYEKVGTNQLAAAMSVSPASANSMVKKLRSKELLTFQRYGKVELTEAGRKIAVLLIRKHRLWETFLYEKLDFTWDEVHEVAEQLEHVSSEKLISKLDEFLGKPKTDPHGEPIPDAQGNLAPVKKSTLAEVEAGNTCRLVSVRDSSAAFLQYVTEIGLGLKSQIKIIEKRSFDNSLLVEIDGRQISVSEKFSLNVFVR